MDYRYKKECFTQGDYGVAAYNENSVIVSVGYDDGAVQKYLAKKISEKFLEKKDNYNFEVWTEHYIPSESRGKIEGVAKGKKYEGFSIAVTGLIADRDGGVEVSGEIRDDIISGTYGFTVKVPEEQCAGLWRYADGLCSIITGCDIKAFLDRPDEEEYNDEFNEYYYEDNEN